ncbi:hypothetical protein HDU76_008003 [Blyttiomyces sp. JEL0837]|nr:hypothetical protein HDU76_008003 [Blyttiomyces sp. JEL0837]
MATTSNRVVVEAKASTSSSSQTVGTSTTKHAHRRASSFDSYANLLADVVNRVAEGMKEARGKQNNTKKDVIAEEDEDDDNDEEEDDLGWEFSDDDEPDNADSRASPLPFRTDLDDEPEDDDENLTSRRRGRPPHVPHPVTLPSNQDTYNNNNNRPTRSTISASTRRSTTTRTTTATSQSRSRPETTSANYGPDEETLIAQFNQELSKADMLVEFHEVFFRERRNWAVREAGGVVEKEVDDDNDGENGESGERRRPSDWMVDLSNELLARGIGVTGNNNTNAIGGVSTKNLDDDDNDEEQSQSQSRDPMVNALRHGIKSLMATSAALMRSVETDEIEGLRGSSKSGGGSARSGGGFERDVIISEGMEATVNEMEMSASLVCGKTGAGGMARDEMDGEEDGQGEVEEEFVISAGSRGFEAFIPSVVPRFTL